MTTRIGYMGIPYSNSEEAALKFAKSKRWNGVVFVPLMSSEGVVRALESGDIDFGVVASSNITAGPVEETETALAGKDDIEKVCTDSVPIHHCVFAKRVDAEIKAISSHIQALQQTRGNLDRLYPGTERVEVEDTAYAAEMLAAGDLPDTTAVVCRRNAGENYDLVMLHENIEDRSDNMTTFTLLRMKSDPCAQHASEYSVSSCPASRISRQTQGNR